MEQQFNKNNSLQVYADLMIEKIKEVEASDWTTPWFTPGRSFPPESLTGRRYNNFNSFFLNIITDKYKYKTPVFTTFQSAVNEKFRILKGSKGYPITYYSNIVKNKETGEQIDWNDYKKLDKNEQLSYKVNSYLKHYTVFNLDQSNYAEVYPEKFDELCNKFTMEVEHDGYIAPLLYNVVNENKWLCPVILEQQDSAYYRTDKDEIHLPLPEQFKQGKEFYYTALHEMAHSTGHPTRLNRKIQNSFGSRDYAREELIAELTSAVMAKNLGMESAPRKENAQYLKGWLEAVQSDDGVRYITTILGEVSKATSMIEEQLDKVNAAHSEQMREEANTENLEKTSPQIESTNSFEATASGNVTNDYSLTVSSAKRTLTITGDKAVVNSMGKEYDATKIITDLQRNNIDYRSITENQWSKMIRGIGVQLEPSKTYSVVKTPSGYGMKILSLAKSITTTAQSEM